jgi:hypothetical protein
MARPELKQEEERKRAAAYDPLQRWRHIQETITWAEANLPLKQRRNRPRWHPAGDAVSSRGGGKATKTA